MNGLKKVLLAMLLVAMVPAAFAEEVYVDVEDGLLSVYPAASITTGDKADAALEAVDHFKATTEAAYIEAQRICYGKFFVTHCLDKVKADHRVTVKAINKVEVEANRFKRQARADQSQRNIDERNANRAATKP